MSNDDDDVRFNVKMPADLRDDAKRNAERGELSKEVRDLFRRKAYGATEGTQPSKLDQKQSELAEVRQQIDELRHKRSRLDTKIESKETRAARLEEQISSLIEERDELEQAMETLENMLHSGERMWPTRIKNAADVDAETARRLYDELKDANADLPDAAFEEPEVRDPNDWRKADDDSKHNVQ